MRSIISWHNPLPKQDREHHLGNISEGKLLQLDCKRIHRITRPWDQKTLCLPQHLRLCTQPAKRPSRKGRTRHWGHKLRITPWIGRGPGIEERGGSGAGQTSTGNTERTTQKCTSVLWESWSALQHGQLSWYSVTPSHGQVSGEDHGGNNGQWKQTQEYVHRVEGNYHLTLCIHKGHERGTYIRNRRAQMRGSHTREDARKIRHSQETSSNLKSFQKWRLD